MKYQEKRPVGTFFRFSVNFSLGCSPAAIFSSHRHDSAAFQCHLLHENSFWNFHPDFGISAADKMTETAGGALVVSGKRLCPAAGPYTVDPQLVPAWEGRNLLAAEHRPWAGQVPMRQRAYWQKSDRPGEYFSA